MKVSREVDGFSRSHGSPGQMAPAAVGSVGAAAGPQGRLLVLSWAAASSRLAASPDGVGVVGLMILEQLP